MKVFKELPPSIYNSIRLGVIPSSKLLALQRQELPVVISLTSIPARLKKLHLVIRSLLVQSRHPKKIVLWLNEDLRSGIPEKILQLQSDLFEICFSEYNFSHRKLIHSLERFPDDIIITCDDDMIYRKNWLELLYKAHLANPDCVIGYRTLHINHDEEQSPLPYGKWDYPPADQINEKALIPIGAWGILYPPKSLASQTLNTDLFMSLAPKNDDLWFKAMALINGTISMEAKEKPGEPIPIIGSQKVALKRENKDNSFNDKVWQALNDHFELNTFILN